MGLGNPVIYDSNPLYGFRPLANQHIHRFKGAEVRFNNLGLRADQNWDEHPQKKILFLGDSVTYGGSYVANQELFSELSTKELDGYACGNAAVNAWGVENIYGLIVEAEFLPAELYVTVLIEGDFYRGPGCMECHSGVRNLELLYYAATSLNDMRYISWKDMADNQIKEKVVEKAVLKLKELDEFIKSKGFSHLIYISPNRNQVLQEAGVDQIVLDLLKRHQVNFKYLLDAIKSPDFDYSEKTKWFHDDVHLEPAGHAAWAKLISQDLQDWASIKDRVGDAQFSDLY